jgi:hypothetical protein
MGDPSAPYYTPDIHIQPNIHIQNIQPINFTSRDANAVGRSPIKPREVRGRGFEATRSQWSTTANWKDGDALAHQKLRGVVRRDCGGSAGEISHLLCCSFLMRSFFSISHIRRFTASRSNRSDCGIGVGTDTRRGYIAAAVEGLAPDEPTEVLSEGRCGQI